jgi:hypothetical protein
MANIQPQDQRINTNLQLVDYTPSTQATLQSGQFRAQAEIAANLRKIEEANKSMEEYKAKREERKLTDQAAVYLGKLGKSNDPVTKQVMQSLAVNTEDPAEVKNFIKSQGGPTEAMKLINDTADSVRGFQQDVMLERYKNVAKTTQPQATYLTSEQIPEFEESEGVTITSLEPAQDADGNTVFEVKGTKPTVVEEEESKINIPETETWAFENGVPQVGRTKGVDTDGDGIDDYINIVEQSATGEYFLNTRDAPEQEKSREDIATDAAVEAFGKSSGEIAAEEVNEFRKKGPVVQSNIYQYERMINGLRSGEIKTGGMVEFFPDIGGIRENLRSFANPTGQDTVDRMVSVVFQNLRETLGAQFTAKEAQQFLDAAYNPRLPAQVNIERMQDAVALMKFAYEEQAKYIAFLQTPAGMSNPSSYDIMPIDAFKNYLNDYTQRKAIEDQQAGLENPNATTKSRKKFIIK